MSTYGAGTNWLIPGEPPAGIVDLEVLPNDPSLLGFDLMTQAFGNSSNGTRPGASSLLVLNLGQSSPTGHARYDANFTASVKPRDDLKAAWGQLVWVVSTHDNRSCYVTFYGSKTPGVGPIQLRTSSRGGGSSIISISDPGRPLLRTIEEARNSVSLGEPALGDMRAGS